VKGDGATFLEVRTETWPGGQWPTLVTGRTDVRHAWTREVPTNYAKHAAWFQRNDPILVVAREMLAVGLVSQDDVTRIDAAVHKEMDEAVKFADESPFPDTSTALTHVWPN
jgi:pyruvate dehydrogenase E1 component alpha subunit